MIATIEQVSTSLSIKDVSLSVFLGWQEEERCHPQKVSLDLDIQFSHPPHACLSDELTDTLCYAKLIKSIETHLLNKQFRLIEHLNHEIYGFIKSLLPKNTRLKLSLSKYPPIPEVKGRVTFTSSDFIS